MHPIQRLKWAAPSMLTIGALVSGLTAVRFAAEQQFELCVKCIFVACVLDGLDGAVARALGTSSDFGFELDSLCDLVNFGVAPALVLHFWMESMKEDEDDALTPAFTWFCCQAYTAACVLRLARFNQKGKDAKKRAIKEAEKGSEPSTVLQRAFYFEGLPAPVGAAYALFPVTLSLSGLPSKIGRIGDEGAWAVGRRGTALLLLFTAFLMVSTIPTFSSKMLSGGKRRKDQENKPKRLPRVPPRPGARKREWFRYYRARVLNQAFRTKKLAGAVVVLGALTSYPFETALATVVIHLVTIPLGAGIYFILAPEDQFKDGEEEAAGADGAPRARSASPSPKSAGYKSE